MKKIHKTSVLLCAAIFVVFAAAALFLKWPAVEKWLKPDVVTASKMSIGADPFAHDPILPSYVKDLHPAYTIEAQLHSTEAKITGKMKVQFDNPQTADLRFFLYDYPTYPIAITSIRSGNQSLSFERRGSVITLRNPALQQKRITLDLQFETSVPRTGTRFGVKDDIWTLTDWYPMLGALNRQNKWYEPPTRIGFGDPFVYHYADYDVSFISPQGYQWVTSWGRGKATPLGQGMQMIRYQAKRITNFSLVGSPLYHVETVTFGPNLSVDIASTEPENIKRIKTIAESVFPAYAQLFGQLPYPHVAIAEANTLTHAMEYSNMAIFRRNLYADNSVDHWLPHEIAHMWWYNSVETLEATYGWIDEGMAELSVYFYKKNRYGDSAAQSVLQEYQRKWDQLKREYPAGKLGKTLHQFSTGEEFDLTWYGKGAMLYDNLRRTIGDDKFLAFLKRLQLNYHGFVVGPDNLDQALGQALGGEAHYFMPNLQRLNRDGFLPPKIQYYVSTVLNGMSFYPTLPAREINQTVYLPLREVMEKLGYAVTASADGQTIRLVAGDNDILLRKNSPTAERNGKKVQMPFPLLESRDRTMVPLAFFQQVLQYRTEYDAKSHTVKITVP